MTQAAGTHISLAPRLIRCPIRNGISSLSLVRILVGCLVHLSLAFTVPAIAQTEPTSGAKSNSISTPAQPVPGAGRFVDITTKSHVSFVGQASHTSKKYLLETMGSGVALLDYDNDGLLDVFFVNGAPLADPTPKGTIPQSPPLSIGTAYFIKRRMALSKMLPRKPACKVLAMAWVLQREITITTAMKIFT